MTDTTLYFIVDLRPEWTRNPYITLWRPDNAGYAYPLPWAGRYTREQVIKGGSYYTQRRYLAGRGHVGEWERFAVPCEDVESVATDPDKIGRNRIESGAGPVVRNSADMRRHLRRLRFDLSECVSDSRPQGRDEGSVRSTTSATAEPGRPLPPQQPAQEER